MTVVVLGKNLQGMRRRGQVALNEAYEEAKLLVLNHESLNGSYSSYEDLEQAMTEAGIAYVMALLGQFDQMFNSLKFMWPEYVGRGWDDQNPTFSLASQMINEINADGDKIGPAFEALIEIRRRWSVVINGLNNQEEVSAAVDEALNEFQNVIDGIS